MENENQILKAALQYYDMGFSIIPIGENKRPIIAEWKSYQTTRATKEQIIKWFEQSTRVNIGIITGRISNIIVIDVDDKDADTSGLTPTAIVKTGRGFHYYYLHPGFPVSCGILRYKIDIKGDGGYVIAPPSLHASGCHYEWVCHPNDVGFADLPQWAFGEKKNIKSNQSNNIAAEHKVYEGRRNDAATRFAGKLLHGLPRENWELGWPTMQKWNQETCVPPLPESELRKTFESIAGREVSKPTANNMKRSNIVASNAVMIRFSDIQSEPLSWLWPGRIALGKLTLIVGDPCLGKSLLTTTLAAIVSKGYPFPVDNVQAPKGDVILLSAEDDAADTTKPRLEAAEADCERIHILKAVQVESSEGEQTQRMFSLKSDLAVLEKLLPSIPECRLLVIDPISAYLDGTESHNNSDVRGLLAPLAALAANYKIAIIAVSHLNKGYGGNALYRTMGSLAFVAAARAAYVVTKDENNPQRRLFLPVKNNLSRDNTGLAYSVMTAANDAPLIAWETEPVSITADEALTPIEPDQEHTATDEAVNFLRDVLAKGAMKASDVQKEARQAGISDKSLRRGREKLGIKPRKSNFTGGWEWSLTEDAQVNQDAHSIDEGTLENAGHLHNQIDTLYDDG